MAIEEVCKNGGRTYGYAEEWDEIRQAALK
jgi:hypothetical protein